MRPILYKGQTKTGGWVKGYYRFVEYPEQPELNSHIINVGCEDFEVVEKTIAEVVPDPYRQANGFTEGYLARHFEQFSDVLYKSDWVKLLKMVKKNYGISPVSSALKEIVESSTQGE